MFHCSPDPFCRAWSLLELNSFQINEVSCEGWEEKTEILTLADASTHLIQDLIPVEIRTALWSRRKNSSDLGETFLLIMNNRSVLSQKYHPFLNVFLSSVAFCSAASPHTCLVPLALSFCPWHAHTYVSPLPSPDNRPRSVMCYIRSSRGNDCADYANVTAAEYISVSTYFHFLHTSHCIALAPSPADGSWTHLPPLELLLRVQFPYVAFKDFSSWLPLRAWSYESNCAAPEEGCVNCRLRFGFCFFNYNFELN